MKPFRAIALLVSAVPLGCNVNVPLDPDGLLGGFSSALDNLAREFEKLVGDPLDSKPFPTLLGGDDQRILYATNLGDIRINFRGATNDVVIPGFVGPSNIYEIRGTDRTLLSPLVFAGALTGLATDGEWIVTGTVPDLETPGGSTVMAGGMVPGNEQVIYASPAGTSEFIQDLTVNEGRAAFVAVNTVSFDASLLVVNLANPAVSTRIDAAGIDAFALRGRYLAYAAAGAGGLRRVALLDLTDGHETALASGLASAGTLVGVVLSNNKVVWSEPGSSAPRIVSHDIPTGVSSILADAVPGRLAGATDTVFVMERFVEGDHNKADRIEIWKYENGGAGRKVEDFRADALAGQTTVLGQRIVFVNPQRRIIIVPLNGGDRKSVQPY